MNYIQDIAIKIKNLKICKTELIVTYIFNNYNKHFCFYLTILSYNGPKKEKFLSLCELIKSFKDE